MNALTKWFNYLGSAGGNPPIYDPTGRRGGKDILDTMKDIYSIETSKKNLELKALQSVAAMQTIQHQQMKMQKTIADEQRAQRKESQDKFDSVMQTFTNLLTDPNVGKETKSHIRMQANTLMVDADKEDFMRLSALSKTVLRNQSEKKTDEWLSMRGPRPGDLTDASGNALTLDDDMIGVATNKFRQMEWSLGLENYTLGDSARPMPKMVYAGNITEKTEGGQASLGVYAYKNEMTGQIETLTTDDLPAGMLNSAVDKGYSVSEFARTGRIPLKNASSKSVDIGDQRFEMTPVYTVDNGYKLEMNPVGKIPGKTGGLNIPARPSKLISVRNAIGEGLVEEEDGLKMVGGDGAWIAKMKAIEETELSNPKDLGLGTERGVATFNFQSEWLNQMGGDTIPVILPSNLGKAKEGFWGWIGNIFRPDIYHYEGGRWSFIPVDAHATITVGEDEQHLWYKNGFEGEEHYWTDHNGVPRKDLFGIPPGAAISEEDYNSRIDALGIEVD